MAAKNITAMKDPRSWIDDDLIMKLTIFFHGKSKKETKKQLKKKWLKGIYLTKTLFKTSRRVCEIVGQKPFTRLPGLMPEHINFDEKTITFYIAKKNQVYRRKYDRNTKRYIPLKLEDYEALKRDKEPKLKVLPVDKQLIADLKKYIEVMKIEDGDRLFDITPRYYNMMLKDAMLETGICVPANKKIRFGTPGEYHYKNEQRRLSAHILRHSFGMHMIKKHPNDPLLVKKLQEYYDHYNIIPTMTYIHADTKQLKDMVDKGFE